MRFDYYERLSARQQATYRKSDGIARVEVPNPDALALALESMRLALEADDRGALGRATSSVASTILTQLNVPPVIVRVLARRPSDENAELHGLYVREETGKPIIRLWMRTAANVRPVKFRTFLRTLVHELLHHLDFDLFELEDTFHTEGFFRRESAMVKQLLGERPARAAEEPAEAAARPKRSRRATEQLPLFVPSKKES
jgi:hypothetical protein